MALQSKTITGNGSRGHHKFTLTVTENSKNDSANTSSIRFTFSISPIQSGWDWNTQGTNISYTITINGTNYTGTIPDYNGSSTVTLKSGTLNVAHDATGTKTMSFSFSVRDRDGESYTCGSASASGSMVLTPTTGQGLVYIDNGSGWDAYQVYIDNGSSWDRYIPYIDNGSGWDMY